MPAYLAYTPSLEKPEGEQLASNAGATTQDFVCVNANAFAAPDAAGFLKTLKLLDKTLELPEGVKHAVSVAAQTANAALKLVHLPSAALESLGAPATHILGESFSTVAPIRYGAYAAKLGFAPGSENLKALTGKHVDLGADYNALEELIKALLPEGVGGVGGEGATGACRGAEPGGKR